MKEKRIEVGVKYRGYGYLNEYGQWCFTPEETGSRVGQRSLVTEGDCFTVASTKKKVLVHLTFERGSRAEMLANLFNVMNNLISVFKNYEF